MHVRVFYSGEEASPAPDDGARRVRRIAASCGGCVDPGNEGCGGGEDGAVAADGGYAIGVQL
eukprot:5939977-Prymnesium_polylepis.2